MLRSLLVGVNGTNLSRRAFELGLHWAKCLRIPLTCIGVIDREGLISNGLDAVGGPLSECDLNSTKLITESGAIQAAVAAAGRTADACGVECHGIVCEGNPAEVLGLEAQRHDLLVIGRGLSPLEYRDRPISTMLSEIIRHSCRPVVIAGEHVPVASDVWIAYDGSLQAARTLQSFVQSGLYFGHPLHVLEVGETMGGPTSLRRAIDYLKLHGRSAELHVLPAHANIAESLVHYVREFPCGLLVIGAYGRPHTGELVLGSGARAILNRVPSPIFLYH